VAERGLQGITGRAAAAAQRLRIDAATAEVLHGFDRAGVESLLVKGPSHALWLYREGERRSYVDADLMVRPGQEPAAEEVLESLGFERTRDEFTMPDLWREHGSEWLRAVDGVWIDLHRNLPGVGADADSTWRVLTAATDTVPVAGHHARTLSEPGRALHVALHAAQHGIGRGRSRRDLDRALEQVEESTWRSAAALAEKLEAIDAFAVGLRLVPAGAALADRLGLRPVRSVEVTLRATMPPPVALGFEQLAQADGLRARAAIVWRKLFPPRAFIVHWDPRAARSRTALALAYVRRPLWILRRAPRGFRAWLRARRDTRARR
jgi:hypothetical protein